jgi:hypothetical protein
VEWSAVERTREETVPCTNEWAVSVEAFDFVQHLLSSVNARQQGRNRTGGLHLKYDTQHTGHSCRSEDVQLEVPPTKTTTIARPM